MTYRLRAETYDALQRSAEQYGVGIDRVWRVNPDADWRVGADGPRPEIPCCILGHAAFATTGNPRMDRETGICEHAKALLECFGDSSWFGMGVRNDYYVRQYNKAHNRDDSTQLTWAEWCEAMNVERGE